MSDPLTMLRNLILRLGLKPDDEKFKRIRKLSSNTNFKKEAGSRMIIVVGFDGICGDHKLNEEAM